MPRAGVGGLVRWRNPLVRRARPLARLAAAVRLGGLALLFGLLGVRRTVRFSTLCLGDGRGLLRCCRFLRPGLDRDQGTGALQAVSLLRSRFFWRYPSEFSFRGAFLAFSICIVFKISGFSPPWDSCSVGCVRASCWACRGLCLPCFVFLLTCFGVYQDFRPVDTPFGILNPVHREFPAAVEGWARHTPRPNS